MIIRAIRLMNFGLYAGMQELLPVSADLGGRPITLVGGLNGRGKTSMLEAVLLVLYGARSPFVREKSRSYPNYLQQLIHRGLPLGTETAVELELTVPLEGAPSNLRIRRSWTRQLSRATDAIKIWRDGLLDENLGQNWETYVEELVPSGVASLFFFDGERISEIADAEETGPGLRGAIRSLLGLDLVDRLIADLQTVIKRNREQLGDSPSATELRELDQQVSVCEIEKAAFIHQLEVKQEAVQEKEADLRQYEQEYLQLGGTIAQNREALQKEASATQARLSDQRAQMVALSAGALPLLLARPLLEQVFRGAQAARESEQARFLLPATETQQAKLLERLASMGVGKQALDRVRAVYQEELNSLSQMALEASAVTLSPIAAGQVESLVYAGLADVGDQAIKVTQQFTTLELELDRISQHLLFRVDEETVTEAFSRLKAAAQEIAGLQSEIKGLSGEIQRTDGLLKQLELRRNAALESLLAQTSSHEDVTRRIEIALSEQERLRKFGVKLTRMKVSRLADAVTEAFRLLMQKTELVETVQIDPATLGITVHSQDGTEIPKNRLSSGERQMLAVSILWGLARASGRDLPVIIDTPLGRLDSSHRMNFVARYLPHASQQVIVLSTDTEIVGRYHEAIHEVVGRHYLLDYREAEKRTEVMSGYFSDEGGGVE